MKIGSSWAFFIYCILMASGFAFTTFFPAAPYLAFAVQLTLGFGAYVGKRLLQKQEKYTNGHSGVD